MTDSPQTTKVADNPRADDDTPDPVRRALLGAALAAGASTYVPWAFAAADAAGGRAAFLSASEMLTGRTSLDSALATRLYDALVENDPQFPTHVQSLLTFIEQHDIDPQRLQHALDASHAALAKLPRTIMTAWYLGVVGEGEHARCLAYETALNAVTVADVLKPPTYCYDVYGSWARKPA